MAAATEERTETEVPKGNSSWAIAYRQFKKDPIAVASLWALVFLGFVAVFSPVIANSKPVMVSYQGGLYFPAFKDYPFPGFMRRTSLFSPKYEQIERPSWQQVPDWRAIRREIDRTGKGWYLSAPVPWYFNEDTSGIKLLPGASLGQIELGPKGAVPEETLEFVPGRPAGQEWAKVRGRLPEGTQLRADLVFDGERDRWTVVDATRAEVPQPEGWEGLEGFDPPGELLAGYGSPEKGRAGRVVLAWRWRDDYLRPGQALDKTPRVAERALMRWRSRDEARRRFQGADWTLAGGLDAVHARIVPSEDEQQRLLGPQAVASDLYLLFAEDRVFSLEVTAPLSRRDDADAYLGLLQPELAATVLGGLAIERASGRTLVEGQPVVGRRFLESGERLDLGGVGGTFVSQPPFMLGSDSHGRCVLSRLIHGTVIAGSVGLVSVGIYVIIGVILGALAGYFRGWVDLVISRVIEVVICFPTLFLIIMVVGFWQKQSIYLIMIALGLIRWTTVARLVRGEILKTMSLEYVSAAKALGLPTGRIIFRHILPNSISPVFVSASFGVAGAILVESSLSFLGFGVAPPTASWGEILRQGREFVNEGLYHLVWAPGICIFLTVTLFNLVGEGLRDAMDPKLRK